METNISLEVKVAQLRAANNYLTKINRVKPRVRIVLQARASADLLAMWHLAGYRTGRPSAAAWGMSDRKWHYGRALLRVAGVYDRNWKTDDLNKIAWSIGVAFERCLLNPELLFLRLPLCRQLRA